jgi:hypothetical protein
MLQGSSRPAETAATNCTFVHFSQLNHILPIFLRTLPKLTAVKQTVLQSFQDSGHNLSASMSAFLLIFTNCLLSSLVISGISGSTPSRRLSEKTGFEIGEMG